MDGEPRLLNQMGYRAKQNQELKEPELRAILPAAACVIALLFSAESITAQNQEVRSRFTVKDSIEISYIVNPERTTAIDLRGKQSTGVPIYSPDHSHFLLVTQRGVLSANCLEGTIWLFDTQSVQKYLSQQSTAKPVPIKLVTVRAPSNMPVIYDVRWIEGSRKVAFLGRNKTPFQRLFLIDVNTGSL